MRTILAVISPGKPTSGPGKPTRGSTSGPGNIGGGYCVLGAHDSRPGMTSTFQGANR